MTKHLSILFMLMASFGLHADEPATAAAAEEAQVELLDVDLEDKQAEKIAVISEAFGHIIAKHIESIGVNFDIASVIKGLKDAEAGKISPMTDNECIEAITKKREAAFKELSAANLDKANSFMQENLKDSTIATIEKGKLHYRVEKPGQGAVVQEGCSPVIRYTGKFLDGTVFGTSKEDDLVVLDETIPGFGKGLMGMKEGEKRILYIHPDLAYGTMGQLPPNSLLIFEIELIKANGQPAKDTAATSETKKEDAKQTAANETTSDKKAQ